MTSRGDDQASWWAVAETTAAWLRAKSCRERCRRWRGGRRARAKRRLLVGSHSHSRYRQSARPWRWCRFHGRRGRHREVEAPAEEAGGGKVLANLKSLFLGDNPISALGGDLIADALLNGALPALETLWVVESAKTNKLCEVCDRRGITGMSRAA